ncbi:chaplin [Actinomadura spongiicola]|nr:chaplin [Actinomadura spongiicola]
MRTWAKGTSRAAVLAAGVVAFGTIPAGAYADITSGTGSVLGGNQVSAPVSAPVDVSGNGASLVGTSHAGSRGGAKVNRGGAAGQMTSGADGVGSGNQVDAPVSAPVNVCGNGVAVVGHAAAGCEGGAKVVDGGSGGRFSDGTDGTLAGNQVNAPISVPVGACGNAAAAVGFAAAGCEGGSVVKNGGPTGSGQETAGVFGVGSGNQASAPISAPVDVCGNAVGNALAGCEGGASVRNGGHGSGEQFTDGAYGVISGNQANAPISIPVTACGNAAALVGHAAGLCEGGAAVRSDSGGDQYTSGLGGVLTGNQGNAPVEAPVDVCGNAAAGVGLAGALCEGAEDGYHPAPGYHSYRRASDVPVTLPGGLGVPANGRMAPAKPFVPSLVDGPVDSGAGVPMARKLGLVKAPLDVCGNAVAGVGALCEGAQDGYHSAPGGYRSYHRAGGVPGGLGVPSNGRMVPAMPFVPSLVDGPADSGAGVARALGSVEPVAAEETVGSMWTLAASALLAALAGGLALTRRVRIGRR